MSKFVGEFDFEVLHRFGELMKHVDTLNRALVETFLDVDEELIDGRLEVLVTISEDYIVSMQRTDTRLSTKIVILSWEELERSRQEK